MIPNCRHARGSGSRLADKDMPAASTLVLAEMRWLNGIVYLLLILDEFVKLVLWRRNSSSKRIPATQTISERESRLELSRSVNQDSLHFTLLTRYTGKD